MAYRFFQSVIVQLKDATDREIGVVDESGLVLEKIIARILSFFGLI